jgi:hypothetical protein
MTIGLGGNNHRTEESQLIGATRCADSGLERQWRKFRVGCHGPSAVSNGPRRHRHRHQQTRHQQRPLTSRAAPSGAVFDLLCVPTGSAILSQEIEDTHTQGGVLEARCEQIGTPVVEQDVSRLPGVGYTGCTPQVLKAWQERWAQEARCSLD